MNLRLFEDPTTGKGWEKSVSDLGLEILCVSQVREQASFIRSSSPLIAANLFTITHLGPVHSLPCFEREQAGLSRCHERRKITTDVRRFSEANRLDVQT